MEMAQVKDHHQKIKNQDHQRVKFLDQIKRIKVKILDQIKRIKVKILDHKVKIPFLLKVKIIKMEIQIQNLMVKLAKMENQNLMVKTAKIKILNLTKIMVKMAIDPQKAIIIIQINMDYKMKMIKDNILRFQL
jgi:hypothetical protein